MAVSANLIMTEVRDGIEAVICRPRSPKHETPILFLHGMWHAAWCWRDWQLHMGEKGWESHAISLPGHGGSPARKSVRFSTMQDYLSVLRKEIGRFRKPPVVIGHSMGGALVQWYLKKVADDFPAVVLVASWTARSTVTDGAMLHLRRDPYGFLKMLLTLSSTPLVRSPTWAASLLSTDGAAMGPRDLFANLCEESALVCWSTTPRSGFPRQKLPPRCYGSPGIGTRPSATKAPRLLRPPTARTLSLCKGRATI